MGSIYWLGLTCVVANLTEGLDDGLDDGDSAISLLKGWHIFYKRALSFSLFVGHYNFFYGKKKLFNFFYFYSFLSLLKIYKTELSFNHWIKNGGFPFFYFGFLYFIIVFLFYNCFFLYFIIVFFIFYFFLSKSSLLNQNNLLGLLGLLGLIGLLGNDDFLGDFLGGFLDLVLTT